MAKKTKQDSRGTGNSIPLRTGGGFEWEKENHALTAQLEENLGATLHVFRELIATGPRVDVHLAGPTEELPFYKLFTVGMSQVEMPAPKEFAECTRAELIMGLPEDWPTTVEAFAQEAYNWTVKALRHIARAPGIGGTAHWVFAGHTVGFGAEPLAPDLKFTGALLLPPLLLPEEAQVAFNTDLDPVFLLGVVPLFPEEMAQAGDGVELLTALDELEVTEILDPQRPNTCEPG